jgi:hypothetical protein
MRKKNIEQQSEKGETCRSGSILAVTNLAFVVGGGFHHILSCVQIFCLERSVTFTSVWDWENGDSNSTKMFVHTRL